jgi:uncharacterized protein (DUF58 family)
VKHFLQSLYINDRFYIVALGLACGFLLGYFYPLFFALSKAALVLIGVLFIVEIILLYRTDSDAIHAERILPERFSNGDKNPVKLTIRSNYPFAVQLRIIDELPFQFQDRKFEIRRRFSAGEHRDVNYRLRPVERGNYEFGRLNIYASGFIGFVRRRFKFSAAQSVAVYPSFIRMRQYELMAVSDRLSQTGSKKIRRISNNKEFEQIKEYVQGDDFRTVNWKATARMSKLMVNQYQDEKAQHVYNIVDLGRSMKMPFYGMSLSDYAINAALALSDVSLVKDDKAGLITFSDKIHRTIKPDSKTVQMQLITEALYSETSDFLESDFEKLYYQMRSVSSQRSLLIIYTNFESEVSLKRRLKVLKMLAKYHVVLIVFFKNTELERLTKQSAETVQQVYYKTIAEKMIFEKRKMVKDLKQYGIFSVLTEPENLTVQTINAYLKMKSDGII